MQPQRQHNLWLLRSNRSAIPRHLGEEGVDVHMMNHRHRDLRSHAYSRNPLHHRRRRLRRHKHLHRQAGSPDQLVDLREEGRQRLSLRQRQWHPHGGRARTRS